MLAALRCLFSLPSIPLREQGADCKTEYSHRRAFSDQLEDHRVRGSRISKATRLSSPPARTRRAFFEPLEDRVVLDGDFSFALGFGSGPGNESGRAVDASGNVYITGSLQGIADFDPGPGTTTLSAVGSDVFVAKYSSTGVLVWARQFCGTGVDQGLGIVVDGSGNVYTTGIFSGTADFDPGAGTSNLTSAGSLDIFVSKLDSAGNFVYARGLGGGADQQGNGIAVDGSGNVYTTGVFSGTADFDPGAGTFNLTSAGPFDIFVSKLDSAGNFDYARRLGGTSGDQGNGIAADGSGNVYTTGLFSGTADFDPGAGTFDLTSAGSVDIFVSKLDSAGNFVYARQLGGTVGDQGYGIAVDGSGNVVTTGLFSGTADFDPGVGTSNLTSAGSNDIFVSKLDSAGNFVYARRLGGSGDDRGNGIAVDGSGNVVTTGLFVGTADFDPGAATFNLTSPGNFDIFVSKLDSAGNFVYARQLGGNSADQGNGIAVDGSGNVYTTGFFAGTADFDPGAGTFNLTSAGSSDIFVSKLDSAGNFLLAFGVGAAAGGSDVGFAVATDASGSVYVTGGFTSTVDFDPGPGTTLLTSFSSGNGSPDVFIAKYTSTGALVWARQLGGLLSEQGLGIAVDGSGNVVTTGFFAGTADFDPGAGTSNLTSVSSSIDIFVSKLDSAGNFVWARQLGGTTNDQANGIAVDGSGNVYTTGLFDGTVDFNPGAGTSNLTSAASQDIFVSKLDSAGNFVYARRLGGAGHDWGNGIAVDGSGNVVTTGFFSGTADFDPGAGTSNLTSAGSNDIFVSKLDSAGNFVYARQLGGVGNDGGNGLAVDGSGNVVTTGFFNVTADFDPGAGTFNLTSASGNDIFVSKLDSAGNFVFARQLGGAGNDVGNGIEVDGTGNVYTTGPFSGTADFDPGALTSNLTSAGNFDIFVSKLDSAGNFVYARQLGGTGNDQGRGLAVDGSGNVVTTGFFNVTADFDPGAGTFNLTSASGNDIFISKLNGIPSNNVPTSVALSGDTVAENTAPGTTIGTLSATDPDQGDSHTFALINDAGGRFAIAGNELQVVGALDFESNPTHSITVRATDSGGLFVDKEFLITVSNVNEPPVVNTGGPYTVAEGMIASLQASATDPEGDILRYDWDVNYEGITFTADFIGDYANFEATNLDGGASGLVAVRVRDQAGLETIATTQVNVENAPAIVSFIPIPGTIVNEGSQFAFTIGFSDGPSDTHAATIDWGDGTVDAAVVDEHRRTVTGTHTFSSAGSGVITTAISDADGTTTVDVSTVLNPRPVFTSVPVVTAVEGQLYQYQVTAENVDPPLSDPKGIPKFSGIQAVVLPPWLTIDAFDSSTVTLVGTPTSSDVGLVPVTLRYTDSFGAFAEQSFTINVLPANQQPVANAGGPYVGQEPATVVLNATSSFDPDPSDALMFEWDLHYDGLSFDVDAVGVQPSVVFADNFASRTIAVRVTDNLGAATIDTATLEITNVTPTIAISGGSNVEEGTPYVLELGAVSDPGPDTVTQYIVDWGDGVVEPYSVNGNQQHTYNDDGPQADKTIIVSLVDEDGTHANVASKVVTVRNVRPSSITVTNATLTGSSSNAVFEATVHFVDPGDADTWTATIDYGDGNVEEKAASPDRSIALHHEYTASGTYTVKITVTDDEGAAVTERLNRAIVMGSKGSDTIALSLGSVIVDLNGVVTHLEDIAEVFVWGGDGDDVITMDPALTVPTTLLGGPGDDWLIASGANVTLDGGAGNNVEQSAVTAGPHISEADGILRIWATPEADVITVMNGYLNVNGTEQPLANVSDVRIWGREGNDQINLTGLLTKSFIDGGTGNDTLTGGSFDDLIFGGLGDDTITGGSGHDFLIGGDGKDRIIGSAGNDILVAGDVELGLTLNQLRDISSAWAISRATSVESSDDTLDEFVTDSDYDMLTGSSGADWFIIGSGDKITDLSKLSTKASDGDQVTYVS